MSGRGRPDGTQAKTEPGSSPLAGAAFWTYSRLLRLYPRDFRATFGGEMEHVFQQTLAESGKQGAWQLAAVLMREIRDLPVAAILQHVQERRKRMLKLFGFEMLGDIRRIRWTARLLSLLFAGLAIAIIVFNLLGKAMLLPTTLVFLATTVFMLVAWRWEKIGGLLTMIASPFAAGSVMMVAVRPQLFGLVGIVNPLTVSLVGLAYALALLIVGWLFISVAQHRVVADEPPDAESRSRVRWVLIAGGIILIVIILVALTLLSPTFIDMEGVRSGARSILVAMATSSAGL